MSRKQTALQRFKEENAADLMKIMWIFCEHGRYVAEGESSGMEATFDAAAELIMGLVKKVSKDGRQPAAGDPTDGSNITPIGRAKAARD